MILKLFELFNLVISSETLLRLFQKSLEQFLTTSANFFFWKQGRSTAVEVDGSMLYMI